MLHVERISKDLGSFAIRNVSFEVAEGDYFVLLGASGAGKTLLLEILAGLTPPDAGSVSWNGTDITRARIQDRRMGLVYQDQALFPHMDVRHNITYPLQARALARAARNAKAESLAETVGVSALLDRLPGTLSGGEAQRVALARALATEPRCLLLDEPLSSLDTHARIHMRGLLRRLNRQGHTIVHVTHDYEEAISLATHVGIMENGTVVQIGVPMDVFHHPKSEFVARFVGIRNVFKGVITLADQGLARFETGPLAFIVSSDAPAGPGSLILRSEDITILREPIVSSAQNSFSGTITDIAPARLGAEVAVNIGVEMIALITAESVERLGLQCGQSVWISFKATAARFIEE